MVLVLCVRALAQCLFSAAIGLATKGRENDSSPYRYPSALELRRIRNRKAIILTGADVETVSVTNALQLQIHVQ